MVQSLPKQDKQILRELAKSYAEMASLPVMDERRKLWRDHFSLKETRTPVYVHFGYWDRWCRELYADERLKCQNPFARDYETWFLIQMHHAGLGDDFICEPWVPLRAAYEFSGRKENEHRRLLFQSAFAQPDISLEEAWGFDKIVRHGMSDGQAWKSEPPIKTWDDLALIKLPRHSIDEEATIARYDKLHDAVGDILEIDIQRGPLMTGFYGDISTALGELRGIDNLMMDMCMNPDELHQLLSVLRDGILANHEAAELAGDFSLTCEQQLNQGMPYVGELHDPRANSKIKSRKESWGFLAAQEYTLVSPEFHDEFLLQYQIPIIKEYGVSHYGCCENLTDKIDGLRKIPNLRSIAVTPFADVKQCAEQIGTDYAISWRPSPANMICLTTDKERIKGFLKEGIDALKGTRYHISLKDVETVMGEPERLNNWVSIARSMLG